MKHKIMQMMYDQDSKYKLKGRIEIDDAYLGGVLKGGHAGRGSENKAAFIAAIETNEEKHPLYARFTPVKSFSKNAVKEWAEANVSPKSHTITDGLACFKALAKFGFHEVHVISKEGHEKIDAHFKWVNTVLSNVKTSLSGTFHSIDFKKYGFRYLADLQFRFNRRFDLSKLFLSLIRNSKIVFIKLESTHMKRFTLIELLMVIAIIGILASLLLSSLGRARKTAKIAACKSQFKQIGTDTEMMTPLRRRQYLRL